MAASASIRRFLLTATAMSVAGCTSAAIEPVRAVLQDCEVNGIFGPARCGTIRVPESRQQPGGRQIDLRVIVVPSYSETPAPNPILPLAGGPGQGAAELAAAMAPRLEPLRAERDLVFVDQRGTGASNRLRCDPPESTAALMGTIFEPARLVACRDQLAQRADLTQYTTPIAAADYGQVLDELGYAHVNVVGVSYGSRLGLELARQFPLRVRTLIVDGVVPPTPFEWPTMGAPDTERALETLIDDCRADPTCADTFPTFGGDVDLAFGRLARGTVMATVRDPATGTIERVPFGTTDLAYATRGILYGNDALALPLWFRWAAMGSFDAFAQAYVTRARALDDQLARGVLLGVYCAEDLPFVDWASAEKTAMGTRIARYLIDEYRRACEVWPRGVLPASFREPVQSSIPTLLLSGRRDPVTPPRTAEVAVRTLPRGRVLVWTWGGHGTDGLTTRDCRNAILREFIRSADPDELPVACMTRDPRLPFWLPR